MRANGRRADLVRFHPACHAPMHGPARLSRALRGIAPNRF
jgi:hypothetical protein